jgi:BlaI family penicillinase repressor
MPTVETLTKPEWEIMKKIWQNGKSTVRDIYESLPQNHRRAYTTIQTYMERLVDKKFLKKEKIGLVNFYTAAIREADMLKRETNHVLKRAFDGSVSKMAAFLFDSQNFDEKDLVKIKELIEKKEHENG